MASERIQVSAATTFRPDEVSALQELFAMLRRGVADARPLLRSAALVSVQRKVATMGETIASKAAARAVR